MTRFGLFSLFLIGVFTTSSSQVDIKWIDTLLVKSKLLKQTNRDSGEIISNHLIQYLRQYKNDSLLAEAIRLKGTFVESRSIDSASLYYNEALLFARNSKSDRIELAVRMNIALNKKKSGKYIEADSIYQELLSDIDIYPSARMKIALLVNVINNKVAAGKFPEAIILSELAFDLARTENYHVFDHILYSNVANIYFNLGDYNSSLDNYKLALNELNNRDNRSISILNSIASCYVELDSTVQAKVYIDSVLILKPSLNSLLHTYSTLYNVYIKTADYNSATVINDTIMELAKLLNHSTWMCISESQIHEIEYLTNPNHSINSDEAEIYKCLKNSGYKYAANKFLETYLLAKFQGENKSLFSEYLESSEKLTNNKIKQQVFDLELKSLKEKQLNDNKDLIAQNKINTTKLRSRRNLLLMSTIGIIFLILISFAINAQSRKQQLLNEKLRKQRDKIKLLNHELNHRTKNNLSFMTSLLEMQGRRTDKYETKQILKDSELRLRALSLVHKSLSINDEYTEINLKIYLEEIITFLKNIYQLPNKSTKIKTSFIKEIINAEDAMRIGLIVNELFTNSIKHAFENVPNPIITIETHKTSNGKTILKYEDNGLWIPHIIEEPHENNSNSLGIKLIKLLIHQLEGRLKLDLYKTKIQYILPISLTKDI